jgi:pimeloyl-ACP methyl ester carboxylesterase
VIAGTIPWRDTVLRYWSAGEPGLPWLVVCHGGSLDHQNFRAFAAAVVVHWRVLLWDLPGHGESQPMPAEFTVAACAEAMAAVMDAAAAARAVVLGHSFGGMVAQYFSRAYPERVAGLIAYGCFAPFLAAAPVPAALQPAILLVAYRLRRWSALQADFAQRCSGLPSVQADVMRAMQALGKAGFLQMTRALIESFTPDPSFRIAAPLLIVSGAADSNGAALRRSLAALHTAHPQSAEIVLPAAGHCAHAEMPQQFLQAVQPFLVRVRDEI